MINAVQRCCKAVLMELFADRRGCCVLRCTLAPDLQNFSLIHPATNLLNLDLPRSAMLTSNILTTQLHSEFPILLALVTRCTLTQHGHLWETVLGIGGGEKVVSALPRQPHLGSLGWAPALLGLSLVSMF